MTTPDRPAPERNRLVTLDALRGFALLGILVPNIVSFAWPMGAMTDPGVMGPGWWNRFGHALTGTVFQGKFMFLFAMLFGSGVVMFDRKTRSPSAVVCAGCGYSLAGLGGDAACPECGGRGRARRRTGLAEGAWLWHRRCAVLLGFGLLHAYLFWYGDILTWYAVAGLTLLWWVRRWPAPAQVWGGLALYAAGALLLIGVTALGLWAADSGKIDPQGLTGGDPAVEIAAYRGGWTDALGARFFQTLMMHLFLGPVFLPGLWGIMMLGMGLTRTGVLTGERPVRFHALLGLGLTAVGAAATGAAFVAVGRATEQAGYLWQSMAQLVGVPLAVGYSQLVVAAARTPAFGAATRALARVGRTALSNYLLQTLVCTTLMYGYGFGLFASVEYPGLFGIVLGVWAVNIVFSAVWLSRFRYGPAEWVWRQLTYLGFRTDEAREERLV